MPHLRQAMEPIFSKQPVRHCDYCGDVLKGRSDKRFCTSECRNGFHNHHAAVNDEFMRKVNKILKKNRRIMMELNPDGKATVHVDRLNDRGFSFNYFTHTYTTKEPREYRYCYEYGYLEYKPDWFVLVRKDRERGERARPQT